MGVHVHIYACIGLLCVGLCLCVFICVHMYVCLWCVYVYMFVHVLVLVGVLCMCVHLYEGKLMHSYLFTFLNKLLQVHY